MSKCDFNTSAWVFFCIFVAYFQNTFSFILHVPNHALKDLHIRNNKSRCSYILLIDFILTDLADHVFQTDIFLYHQQNSCARRIYTDPFTLTSR